MVLKMHSPSLYGSILYMLLHFLQNLYPLPQILLLHYVSGLHINDLSAHYSCKEIFHVQKNIAHVLYNYTSNYTF